MPTPHAFFVDAARRRSTAPRRLLVGSALASVVLGSLVVGASSADAAPANRRPAAHARTTYSPVTARRSESVVDAYGLGIHTAYWDTPYGDTARLTAALKDLGVEHVRDDLWNNTPRSYTDMNAVAQNAGVKYDLILGNPSRGQAASEYMDTIAQKLQGTVELIEGANEWDNFGGANWTSTLRSYQSELYAAAKANPATAGLPLLAPSLAFSANYAELGTQTGVADIGNSHLYPGGRKPSVDIAAAHQSSENRTGTNATIVTEAGYQNATSTTSGHHPVSEAAAATYLPRMLAEHVLAGTKRVYSYELIDESVNTAKTDIEAHFGLLRHDWSPKPAYTAMKNLLALLDDDESRFSPDALSYSTSGADSDLRQILTQRSDGTFVLLLWRDVSVWSTSTRSATNVATTPVTVSLAEPSRVQLYQPNGSATPTPMGARTEVTVPLGAELVALTLTDAPQATGTTPAPAPAPATPEASGTTPAPAQTPAPAPSTPETPGTTPTPAPGAPETPGTSEVPAEPGTSTDPTVPVVDEADAFAPIEQVLVDPFPSGAVVSWKLAPGPAIALRAMPSNWTIRVYRGTTEVRSLTQPRSERSIKVTGLASRLRYRFSVEATSVAGPMSEPVTSRYVKPNKGQVARSAWGQRAPRSLRG